MNFNDTFPWMTFLTVVIALVIVAVGGIVVILGNLTFDEYLNDLTKFAVGVGLVAVGRGIKQHGTVTTRR